MSSWLLRSQGLFVRARSLRSAVDVYKRQTKYGLNGTMPATVNSTVGSCGMRLAEGTTAWALAAKKSRKAERS